MAQQNLLLTQQKRTNDENSLLAYFFGKYNSGLPCTDLVYDIATDRMLHLSNNFQQLTNRRCNQTIGRCLPFIKSFMHPDDYAGFLVELVEFVKLKSQICHRSPDELIRSFSFRVKNEKSEWIRVNLHIMILPSKKIVGIVRLPDAGENTGTTCISAREREILNLIANGDSAKIIGFKLNISPNTVITHRNNLKKKLGAKNTAELIKEAFKTQVI